MLGPRPGAKKRANKLNVSGLGRSLVNQQKKDQQDQKLSDRYTTEANPYGSGSNLQSVTEQRPLDELLSTAELSGKDFTTERTAAIKVISRPAGSASNLSSEERDSLVQQHYLNAGKLTVPRRPKWSKNMSAHELDSLEKEAFLAWRRSLAMLQEDPKLRLAMTPFERNIEVWRQLWRVIERSHLVVQIVDARNPLFYRSEDLDTYVRSFGTKDVLLLINKADLLTDLQRTLWQQHLVKSGIPFAFFSAKQSSVNNLEGLSDAEHEVAPRKEELENTTSILSVEKLEALFKSAAPAVEDGVQLQIGLVGYPNVGKSSTINALIGAKKVSVSSTPGKTKHFQTINLTEDLMLCDCPGLVFPNFAQTKAELVCQGVLPIDQLRDCMSPSALVTERIPKVFLEHVYHIRLHTDPVTALDLLETYAAYRGFNRTGGGAPDSSRSARLILKDYVNAKLPFAMPPPSFEGSEKDFNAEFYEAAAKSITVSHETAPDGGASEAESAHALSVKSQSKNVHSHSDDYNAEDDLDRDFFNGVSDRGTASLPFHLRGKSAKAGGKSSKKHNKGR